MLFYSLLCLVDDLTIHLTNFLKIRIKINYKRKEKIKSLNLFSKKNLITFLNVKKDQLLTNI